MYTKTNTYTRAHTHYSCQESTLYCYVYISCCINNTSCLDTIGNIHIWVQVIHRRLGVRNILLKTDDVGRVVAKVAGFGPIRSEVQRRDTDKVDVRNL